MPAPPASLSCTIQTASTEYEHRGVTVGYEVYVDPDETKRHVIAGARNPDGRRCLGPESKTVCLVPSLVDRLRERLTSYEFAPLPEYEHVREVTETIEDAIDHAREVQERHTEDLRITHVNGEPVPEGETPTAEVNLGDEGGA
jgi:predicted RNase H-like HicB family nuclease